MTAPPDSFFMSRKSSYYGRIFNIVNIFRLVKIQKISTSPENQNTQDIVQPRHVAAG